MLLSTSARLFQEHYSQSSLHKPEAISFPESGTVGKLLQLFKLFMTYFANLNQIF